jgi:hypothetical protein
MIARYEEGSYDFVTNKLFYYEVLGAVPPSLLSLTLLGALSVTSDTFFHHFVSPSLILAVHGAARPVLYSHFLQVVILTMCHDLALNNGCHSLCSCRLSCNVVTINVDCLLPESEVTRLRLYCVIGRATCRLVQVLPPLFLTVPPVDILF